MVSILDRLALVSVASLAIFGGTADAATNSTTLGFAIKTFVQDIRDGADDCPHGLAQPAKLESVDVDAYLKSVPAADAARLKAFPRELHNLIGRRGPNRTDVCENPTSVPDPGMPTVEGKVAAGFNLDGTEDGRATPITCAHQKFTGPNGQAEIDDQLFRVWGCVNTFRGRESTLTSTMRSGMFTLVMEVSGVDDPRNSKDVKVGFHLGVDALTKTAAGDDIVPDQSIQIDDNPKYQTVVHGKIVDGVLTTEPADIPLLAGFQGKPDHVLFRNARLRMELQPDGNAKGMLGAYLDWRNIFIPTTRTEGASKFSCDAYYYALQRLADGYPDPKTGQCTAISVAYKVEAVRAFLYRDVKSASAAK